MGGAVMDNMMDSGVFSFAEPSNALAYTPGPISDSSVYVPYATEARANTPASTAPVSAASPYTTGLGSLYGAGTMPSTYGLGGLDALNALGSAISRGATPTYSPNATTAYYQQMFGGLPNGTED